MSDDPILARLQQIIEGSNTTIKEINKLEALLHQLFDCMRQIEAEHARLMASSPIPPVPPRPH